MLQVGSLTPDQRQIIAAVNASDVDQQQLMSDFHLTAEFLRYATDPLERARVEYNQFTQTWLLVFNVPVVANQVDKRVIKPVSFILRARQIFVFVTEQTKQLLTTVTTVNQAATTGSPWDVILAILYEISTTYFDSIQKMTETRLQIEANLQNLHRRSSSHHIFELTKLSTDLTYFLTGANGNSVALGQLQLMAKRDEHATFSAHNLAQIEDVAVETHQAQQMLELNSDIVDKLSNTFNNLLNNNLNQVMKLLTIYSVVLMIPPIIFGFYGMNMALPLADKQWSWVFSVIISIAPIIWVMYRLKHDHFI